MIRIRIWSCRQSKSSRLCSGWTTLHVPHTVLQSRSVTTVPALSSWTINSFRGGSFAPQTPIALVVSDEELPPALTKWFVHEEQDSSSSCSHSLRHSELNSSFWEAHGDSMVPLEITTTASGDASSTTFDRVDAPLNLLLAHIERTSGRKQLAQSVYLAQHDLRDLPQPLQDDLPTPLLVKHAGKGDLYSSSLWLGRPPTYTPLHRDPNPNLFMQLAGTKVIRLFRPEIGDAIFDHSAKMLNRTRSGHVSSDGHPRSAAFRGEEMMIGRERSILHDLVWEQPSDKNNNSAVLQHAQEATLEMGQALFIPKGWWHSVKGIGNGVTASANWWFR